MTVLDFFKDNILLLDGGMGTLLQARGLGVGELPEEWCLTHPDDVIAVHRAYFEAGSRVVCANTFGANVLKYTKERLEEIVAAAIACARRAAEGLEGEHFVALDIGPTGKLLAPLGDLDFEDAVNIYAQTVALGVKYGADLIFIETMNDTYEAKAALLAAKEQSTLPVFASCAFGADGKLMTGADPAAVVALFEGLGADAIGVNCSLGPTALAPVVEQFLSLASVPVILKPNAGLPQVKESKTVYDIAPDAFACEVARLVSLGVRAVGGCCGTTPAYIAALAAALQGKKPLPVTDKGITCVSSYTHAVNFANAPILIGERINPTGKKRLKEALRANDMDYILAEALGQEEQGAQILDVNVGLPDIDEPAMLMRTVSTLQAVTALPLQIDTADAVAMEQALRRYNGKAMINSVNGKAESMAAIFPLVKKYGGVVVALTLDENGIPATAAARVEIAKRIIAEAAKYGISKKDIVIDPLALTISADDNAARETLAAVASIRQELCVHTSLGVSNVSFGLPMRDTVTSTFFALALGRGLSAAIMNPYSTPMMKTYHAYRALAGLDKSCAAYIGFATALPTESADTGVKNTHVAAVETSFQGPLQSAIAKGLVARAARAADELLHVMPPLAVVENEVIPALNAVGVGFEKGSVYLPQLLMSAEAAKAAFERIKQALGEGTGATRGSVVLATVAGDIHDIGKNIVKLLLQNYGFDVHDLGRDVSPEAIAECAVSLRAPLVALSALMTTTVPAMEKTISLLREKAPWCRVMVGGAVLTAEYAQMIGADYYACDAMAAVRYAESVM
ncbi:MAG: homocysteine S-methyltransferase family protein [Clostridia bacterium]|nr:homocysteine S-methyltransferase family protein [Clostridia bacterium]